MFFYSLFSVLLGIAIFSSPGIAILIIQMNFSHCQLLLHLLYCILGAYLSIIWSPKESLLDLSHWFFFQVMIWVFLEDNLYCLQRFQWTIAATLSWWSLWSIWAILLQALTKWSIVLSFILKVNVYCNLSSKSLLWYSLFELPVPMQWGWDLPFSLQFFLQFWSHFQMFSLSILLSVSFK